MTKITIKSLNELDVAAQKFIDNIDSNKVFAFNGSMGAGKTTFIKAICRLLGVEENITSPTFAIVNEYITTKDESIYHFDCYRLKNIQEAYDFGAEEYFYSGNLCFIEWPDIIEDLLPANTVFVDINVNEDQSREITLCTE